MSLGVSARSGVAGAVIGAGATRLASRRAITGALQLDREERHQAETNARFHTLRALAAELRLNASMKETQASHALIPYVRNACDAAFPYFDRLM